MSRNQKESTVTFSNDEENHLQPSYIFTGCFKFIYRILGVTFKSRRDKWSRILSIVLAIRLTITIIVSFFMNVSNKPDPIIVMNDFAYDCFPLVEFLLLAARLPRFNNQLETYARHSNIQISEEFIRSIKRLNGWCVFFILTQDTLSTGATAVLFKHPRNWLVRRTFPFETPLGPLAENIIGHLVIIYEYYLKNYIPLSVSLYLCYYRLLIGIRGEVLSDISLSTSCKYIHRRLEELNKFIDLFEETFSILPLCWLSYSIGPGLSYALNLSPQMGDKGEIIRKLAFLFKVLWNFIAVLFVLYLVSRWQSEVDSTADSLVWKMEANIQSTFHSRILDRITGVLKRRVTVWDTCPIEKMLLLSFIGSALTFSVFFLQLSSSSILSSKDLIF